VPQIAVRQNNKKPLISILKSVVCFLILSAETKKNVFFDVISDLISSGQSA
jgi:hypothetical protein